MWTCNLIGNVGNDPEVRHSADGGVVVRFSVAHNYRKRDQEGDWQDRTEWVRVIVFGQLAKTLAEKETVKRGMKIYIAGRVELAPWTRNDGTAEAGAQVLANEVVSMMPSTGDGGGNRGDFGWGNDMTGRPSGRQRQPAGVTESGDDLEDLPF